MQSELGSVFSEVRLIDRTNSDWSRDFDVSANITTVGLTLNFKDVRSGKLAGFYYQDLYQRDVNRSKSDGY